MKRFPEDRRLKTQKDDVAENPGGLRPTSIVLLLVLSGSSLIATFFFVDSWITAGNVPFMAPRWGFVVPLLLAVFVLWQGWLVKAYQEDKKVLSPLAAGRIWLLTQAASRTGAIVCGLASGVVVSYSFHGETAFLNAQILNFSLAASASFVFTVAAWVAERWCVVNDGDNGGESGGAQSALGDPQPV